MSRAATILTTTLTDIDGEPHAYSMTRHGFDEGFDLMAELGEMVGAVAAEGAGGIGSLDSDVNIGEIAKALPELPRLIMAKSSALLFGKIFKYLRRQDEGQWQQLKTPADRTAAFSGNHLEALEAAKWVLEQNFGPFFAESIARLKQHFGLPSDFNITKILAAMRSQSAGTISDEQPATE